MKFGLKLLLLGALGLLIAACAPAAPVTPTVEASIDQSPANAPEAAENVNVAEARPRFLDAYADW